MGFFGTTRAKKGTVVEVAGMIEKLFRKKKLDLHRHELEAADGYGWWLQEGSAIVYVFVQDEPYGPVIRVTSPLVHFPLSNREAFMARLLELNRDLVTCCFASYQDIVVLNAQRPTAGLDAEELEFLIWNVARFADKFDDELAHEWGCLVYREQ